MKRIVFLSTVAALLPQVSHACIKLDGVAVRSADGADHVFETVGLRHKGDVWAPSLHGCNLIPCGTFGNHQSESKRIRFSAKDDESIKIKAELTKLWEGGHVEFEFKYGTSPDFSKTPGWDFGNIVVAPNSDMSQIFKTVTVEPAFSYNATIQVAYHTNGLERKQMPGHAHRPSKDMSAKFYQCIDIEVVDGLPYPEDAPTGGLGPYEVDGFPDIHVGGLSLEAPGLKPFWIAFIVLVLLISLGLCIMVYLWQTRKADMDDQEFEPVVAKTEPVPEPPAKPATPPPEPEEEEEAVARIHYKDEDPVEVEEPEVEEKASDGTGSQGRHFHFRYVEEDDQV